MQPGFFVEYVGYVVTVGWKRIGFLDVMPVCKKVSIRIFSVFVQWA